MDTGTDKSICFFVLGGPGSGKGTVCQKLVDQHGFVHLCTDGLLKKERDSGSPDGQLISNIILKGGIVPAGIAVNLIKKAMEKNGPTNKKFLIEGFPANQDHQDGWARTMKEYSDMKFVVFLDCAE